jgi:hypothetical protein
MASLTEPTDVDEAEARLQALIRRSGARALTLEDLRAMREVWPADESVDVFLEARERWRAEAPERTIPVSTPSPSIPTSCLIPSRKIQGLCCMNDISRGKWGWYLSLRSQRLGSGRW